MCYRKSIIVNYSYLVVHCPLAIQETRQPVAPYPPQRRRYLKQRRRWCCVARPSRLIGWSSWRFRPPSLREFQWIEGLGFWCCFFFVNFQEFPWFFCLFFVSVGGSSVQGLCCLKTCNVCVCQFDHRLVILFCASKLNYFYVFCYLCKRSATQTSNKCSSRWLPGFFDNMFFSGMLLSYIHQELLCHCGRPLESIRHIRPWWMRWLSFSTKPTPYC